MATSRHPVTWEGAVVGEIQDISCDNFNVFGKWHPANSDATADFYEHLKAGKELKIRIGSLMDGIIDAVPGDEIEFKISP